MLEIQASQEANRRHALRARAESPLEQSLRVRSGTCRRNQQPVLHSSIFQLRAATLPDRSLGQENRQAGLQDRPQRQRVVC